jgi:hypothetical protein
MTAPWKPSPDHCPRCDLESPCVDWVEVDIGVGVQTGDYQYECPQHGVYAWVDNVHPEEVTQVAADMVKEGREDEASRVWSSFFSQRPVPIFRDEEMGP